MRRYDDRLLRVAHIVGPREITEEDLVNSQAWRELRAVLIAALEPFPEARQAVVTRLWDHYAPKRRRR
jgi:hypothetical protein